MALLLLLETELLDDGRILTLVVLLQVAEVRTAVSHHLQEAATGMEVLLIFLQVLRQFLDLAGKERDLDRRRPRILVVLSRTLYSGGLYAFRKH